LVENPGPHKLRLREEFLGEGARVRGPLPPLPTPYPHTVARAKSPCYRVFQRGLGGRVVGPRLAVSQGRPPAVEELFRAVFRERQRRGDLG